MVRLSVSGRIPRMRHRKLCVQQAMIEIVIPGSDDLRLVNALLDFNGTLAFDGWLIEGTADRLRALAALLELHLMPHEDQDTAKRAVLARFDAARTVAVGNGRNDLGLLEQAALSIIVIGREGCAAASLARADIVCASVVDALDLLLAPRRIVATLRR